MLKCITTIQWILVFDSNRQCFLFYQYFYILQFFPHIPTVNVVDGEMLLITKVSRLHMAAYLCVASNGV